MGPSHAPQDLLAPRRRPQRLDPGAGEQQPHGWLVISRKSLNLAWRELWRDKRSEKAPPVLPHPAIPTMELTQARGAGEEPSGTCRWSHHIVLLRLPLARVHGVMCLPRQDGATFGCSQSGALHQGRGMLLALAQREPGADPGPLLLSRAPKPNVGISLHCWWRGEW